MASQILDRQSQLSVAPTPTLKRRRQSESLGDEDDRLRRLKLTGEAEAVEESSSNGNLDTTASFRLLPKDAARHIRWALRSDCGLEDVDSAEDAFPCTSFQEHLIARSIGRPGPHFADFVFKITQGVNIEKFKQAWDQVIALCSNLRTRIISASDGLWSGRRFWQVVIKNAGSSLQWEDPGLGGIGQWAKAVQYSSFSSGSPLCRFALGHEADGPLCFVLIIHHAIFDIRTLSLMFDALGKAYRKEQQLDLNPHSLFVEHVGHLDQQAMEKFWEVELSGARRCMFPSPKAPTSLAIAAQMEELRYTAQFLSLEQIDLNQLAVFRLAWALVLTRYIGTERITFGAIVPGRSTTAPGIGQVLGPTTALVPIKVELDSRYDVYWHLNKLEEQASIMADHEHYGLENIVKIHKEIADAVDFTSLLVIQTTNEDDLATAATKSHLFDVDEQQSSNGAIGLARLLGYPLVLQCSLRANLVEFLFNYDTSLLNEGQIYALARQTESTVAQVARAHLDEVGSIDVASEWDRQQVVKWNLELRPNVVDSCLHELIDDVAKHVPESIAIQAFDCVLTYRQLVQHADRLARHLVTEMSVTPETIVPVCFDHSAWYFVAILAVNKAGGVWVPLEPSHPSSRLAGIISEANVTICLASTTRVAKLEPFCQSVLAVDGTLAERLQLTEDANDRRAGEIPTLPTVHPGNAAYVLFTSGSTGKPKALVMEHRSVCTSIKESSARIGIDPSFNILQFAAYIFDMSVAETFGALLNGATLTIPSEDIRVSGAGLSRFVHRMGVNMLYLTPSFSRTIRPADVPSVKVVLLAGETVTKDVFNQWFGKVRLMNGWGPAETCCFSSLHEYTSSDESPSTIGRPVSSSCWIVDPNDPNRLAPIGTEGEVYIQGPCVLRGYLNDPEKSHMAIATDLPAWSPKRNSRIWDRAFRSGDLCTYQTDGTMKFIGRMDTQVKIRGVRVELGEVEAQVHSHLEGVNHVVVDVLRGHHQDMHGAMLAAFVCFDHYVLSSSSEEGLFLPIEVDMQPKFSKLIAALNTTLPGYMVPTLFIPCRAMPFVTSTKIDRRRLLAKAYELIQDDLADYSLQDRIKQAPQTETELMIQIMWAEIMGIPPETVGRDDSFFALGGDSISLVCFISAARAKGVSIRLGEVFKDPRLCSVAAKLEAVSPNPEMTGIY